MHYNKNYQSESHWKDLGFRTEAFLIHHSNGAIKTPNTSAVNVGINISIHYTFYHKNKRIYSHKTKEDSIFREPIKYNIRLVLQRSFYTNSTKK